MFIAKSLMTVFIAAFALTVMDAIAKDVVYRWVDDKGVVHFGDQPAESANAEVVDIQSATTVNTQPANDAENASPYQQPSEPSRAQQQRDERAKNHQKAAELKEEIAANCERNRMIVSRLEPTPRVIVTGENGEVYRLDDAKRLKTLNEAKSYIAENCNK